MSALTKLFHLRDPTRRHQWAAPAALLLAFALTLPAAALAQHAGGPHGGGYGHGYAGHGYGGHYQYGHDYYGHGYYGGWGGWWYPWAYGAAWYYPGYWWYGAPYYYGYDAYYRGSPYAYEVVPAPGERAGAAAGSGRAAAVSTELFAYPMKHQTTAQQSQDRYECHRWAADQTGFDPTQANGGVSANEASAKRDEYVRAETACLAGRGYSVK